MSQRHGLFPHNKKNRSNCLGRSRQWINIPIGRESGSMSRSIKTTYQVPDRSKTTNQVPDRSNTTNQVLDSSKTTDQVPDQSRQQIKLPINRENRSSSRSIKDNIWMSRMMKDNGSKTRSIKDYGSMSKSISSASRPIMRLKILDPQMVKKEKKVRNRYIKYLDKYKQCVAFVMLSK